MIIFYCLILHNEIGGFNMFNATDLKTYHQAVNAYLNTYSYAADRVKELREANLSIGTVANYVINQFFLAVDTGFTLLGLVNDVVVYALANGIKDQKFDIQKDQSLYLASMIGRIQKVISNILLLFDLELGFNKPQSLLIEGPKKDENLQFRYEESTDLFDTESYYSSSE